MHWVAKKFKHSFLKHCFINIQFLQSASETSVAYAENFRGGAKFRHNRVTSQINFRGSAESTTILGVPGACPGKILQSAGAGKIYQTPVGAGRI